MLFILLSLLLTLMESPLTLEKVRKRSVFSNLFLCSESKWCLSQPLTLHRPSSSAAEEEPGAAGLTLSFIVAQQSRLSELRFPHLKSLNRVGV